MAFFERGKQEAQKAMLREYVDSKSLEYDAAMQNAERIQSELLLAQTRLSEIEHTNQERAVTKKQKEHTSLFTTAKDACVGLKTWFETKGGLKERNQMAEGAYRARRETRQMELDGLTERRDDLSRSLEQMRMAMGRIRERRSRLFADNNTLLETSRSILAAA